MCSTPLVHLFQLKLDNNCEEQKHFGLALIGWKAPPQSNDGRDNNNQIFMSLFIKSTTFSRKSQFNMKS